VTTNPILVIHDRNNGVFFLNLQTKEKSNILDYEGNDIKLQPHNISAYERVSNKDDSTTADVKKSKAKKNWRGKT